MSEKTQESKQSTDSGTIKKGTELKIEHIAEANLQDKLKKLMQPVPKEYLETYTDNGIEFTGYKAQYAINLLNEVFGLKRWYASFNLEKVENIKGAWISYGTIKIFIADKDSGLFGVDTFLADGIGGSYARRIENSLKGTKTSAFKNACRYLGIGNELYLAGHDEDIIVEDIVEEKTKEKEDTSSEVKDIIAKINSVTTLSLLETTLPLIEDSEGKAVQDLLTKTYNKKKIELTDKK